jgi:FkbM family methyltransferase
MIIPIKVCDEEFKIQVHDEDECVSNIIREQTIYSINDLKQFSKFLTKGDYFVDVGANIGWHTLFGAKVVGETGKVFAFEPGNKNFNLLESNIKLNDLQNITAVKAALTDYTGNAELACSKRNYGDNVTIPLTKTDEVKLQNWYGDKMVNLPGDKEPIECTTLDEYIKNNNIDASKIKLIKMDIQGSEPKALDGMKDLIKKYSPAIILEYSPHHIKLCGSSPFDILSFIDKNDYVPYHIKEDRSLGDDAILYHVTVMDIIEATREIFASKVSNGFDILLIKGKK